MEHWVPEDRWENDDFEPEEGLPQSTLSEEGIGVLDGRKVLQLVVCSEIE